MSNKWKLIKKKLSALVVSNEKKIKKVKCPTCKYTAEFKDFKFIKSEVCTSPGFVFSYFLIGSTHSLECPRCKEKFAHFQKF